MITNRLQLVIGPQLEPDKDNQSLFEKSSLDDMTQSVLQQLCTVIKDKSTQLFKDFLENDNFLNPSETLAKKSESCPPNNISVERVFGELDTKIKQAPNCNISNIEACLMYKNNNTGQWLKGKSDIEQQHIINDAVAKSRQFNINVKENKKYLYDQRVISIKERERLKKEREKKKKIKENIPKDLEDIGIWNNIETIENNLAKMKTKKEKTTALKQQINMCRKIVQVSSNDKYIFQFSKKGK